METQKIYLDGTKDYPWPYPYMNGNNNGGLFGNNGNGIVDLIALLAVFNGGFNGGFAGNGGSPALLNEIQRNGMDVNTLATNFNCSIGQVKAAIDAFAAQAAQCCCDNKLLTTQQGYENQIAIANQTAALASKIDAQTTFINDKFCAQEMREMQNKIDALREENSTYKTSTMTSQIVSNAVAPINAVLSALKSDVDGIKCKLPETIPVQANRGVYLDACCAAQLGLGGLAGFGIGNGSLWG